MMPKAIWKISATTGDRSMSRPRLTAFLTVALALLLSASSAFAQATVMPVPRLMFTANDGNPCSGCVLTGYLAGTTTPQDIYTDSSLTTNIASVTMNSAGRPAVAGNEVNLYMAAVNYKFILTTSGGTTIWTADNVRPDASALVLPSTFAVGDILYADTTSSLARLADVSAGSYLRSGGVNTAPLWSTLKLPNTATANRIPYASATNTWGESANLTFDGSTFTTLAISGTTGAFSSTLGVTGTQTNAADLAFSNNRTIRRNTSDASDSGFVGLNGGGGNDRSRGFSVELYGNEASAAGAGIFQIGNVALAEFLVRLSNGSGVGLNIKGDDGEFVATGIYDLTDAGAANVVVLSGGGLKRSTSSARYKANIQPLAEWRWFLRLQPVSFTGIGGTRTHGGFLAEDVATYSPRGPDGRPLFAGLDAQGRPDDVAYPHLVAVAQQGLVDHEDRLDRQLDLIAGIAARLRALETENAALRAEIRTLQGVTR